MRSISFSLTEPQFLANAKTVTRRLGWKRLRVGDHLRVVRKAMGLKKGEHPVVLGEIEITRIDDCPLDWITRADCRLEGFPEYTPEQFIVMFCREMKCKPDHFVRRIEFRRIK